MVCRLQCLGPEAQAWNLVSPLGGPQSQPPLHRLWGTAAFHWEALHRLCPFSPDPCHNVTCRPQEKCEVKDGQAVCVPNSQAVCWLWGDPHYHSFDGRNFDFMGTCDYVLATTECPAGSDPGLTPFTVTTKNENRGNPAVSYVRQVTVSTLGVNISIHKNEIGNVRVSLAGGPRSLPPAPQLLEGQERLSQAQLLGTPGSLPPPQSKCQSKRGRRNSTTGRELHCMQPTLVQSPAVHQA